MGREKGVVSNVQTGKKVYLELTDAERRLVRMYLMNWRNKLTAQGRDAGPVNDLLLKLMAHG